MIDKGQWTQQGLKKFQAAIKSGEPVEITHFIISGNPNLGSLADFSGSEYLTADTFPHEIFRKKISYSYIADDGRGDLVVFCEIEADNEEEFFCNGIGLIFEDPMGQEYLMAVSELPIQQRTKTVNQTFEFKLPIVNDAAEAITVTFEPEDRVSQAQLSAGITAHSESVDSHADHRNAAGAAIAWAVDAAGLAHKEIARLETADTVYREANDALHAGNDDYHITLAAILLGAVDSAAMAHREHSKTLTQRFQGGTITIGNQGIIRGCVVEKSMDATRNLTMAGGTVFSGGAIMPVIEQINGASVPENTGEESAIYRVYFDADNELICIPAEDEPAGILLYEATVPAGNTEATDPHLGSVGLTDLRRLEPLYPQLMTACPVHFVGFDYDFDTPDYSLDLAIEGYSGSPFGVGDIDVLSRAKNGFSVQHTGTADDVTVRWSARKLDL